VIGSAVGGITDIIKDQETGLLVRQKDPGDLAEKINRVLTDEELSRRLGKRGYDFAKERFSWSFIAGECLQIFRSVLEKRAMPVGVNGSRS
jgi:glycosyltransferase involved in cell wall biosynthesis